MIEKIRELNPEIKIYKTSDKEFLPYGKILDMDVEGIIAEAEKIPMPEQGSMYQASVEAFERLNIKEIIQKQCFGELPTQVGYCYGYSDTMNAMEWHKNSEINIAVTDLILLLGHVYDIDENGKYDSKNVKAFYVQKGEAIEVYATSLHFCPCMVEESGFGCVVALPEGTNLVLDEQSSEPLLFKKNKWIICHEENESLKEKGVYPGIFGENYKIKTAE